MRLLGCSHIPLRCHATYNRQRVRLVAVAPFVGEDEIVPQIYGVPRPRDEMIHFDPLASKPFAAVKARPHDDPAPASVG